jgi:hypothetical protein
MGTTSGITNPFAHCHPESLRPGGGRLGMNAHLQITAQLPIHLFIRTCHPDEGRGRIWPQPRVCAKFTAARLRRNRRGRGS